MVREKTEGIRNKQSFTAIIKSVLWTIKEFIIWYK
jgi:hypothetical protein